MNNRSSNDKTLEAYNKKVASYIKNTPQEFQPSHKGLLKWIDESLKAIPSNGSVFEIGSGTGREARHIRSKGYAITCSDGAQSFVDYLRQNGEDAVTFNALKDEFPNKYNMIFANAVVPHFTDDDLRHVVRKSHNSLHNQGILSFSTKQGQGEMWITEKFSNKRYINYWQLDELEELMTEEGFKVIYRVDGIPGDLPTHTWIHIVGKKI